MTSTETNTNSPDTLVPVITEHNKHHFTDNGYIKFYTDVDYISLCSYTTPMTIKDVELEGLTFKINDRFVELGKEHIKDVSFKAQPATEERVEVASINAPVEVEIEDGLKLSFTLNTLFRLNKETGEVKSAWTSDLANVYFNGQSLVMIDEVDPEGDTLGEKARAAYEGIIDFGYKLKVTKQ